MKDRISMALKDPILQQGFEIICKENTELKEQLGDKVIQKRKDKVDIIWKLKTANEYKTEQLTKAKDIIKNLIDDWETMEGEQVRELKSVKEAEQFLKE